MSLITFLILPDLEPIQICSIIDINISKNLYQHYTCFVTIIDKNVYVVYMYTYINLYKHDRIHFLTSMWLLVMHITSIIYKFFLEIIIILSLLLFIILLLQIIIPIINNFRLNIKHNTIFFKKLVYSILLLSMIS